MIRFLARRAAVAIPTLLLVSILACPVGAILGHVALRRIGEDGRGGRGLALTGVIVGWVGTALLVLGIALVGGIFLAAAGAS